MMRPLFLIIIALVSTTGMSQDFRLDTQEVLDVIKKWNFAVNARSEETLRELYSEHLVYYAREISREQCITARKNFFDSNPSYKQKIVTDPTFVPHTAGVVKSNFVKEIFQNGRWKKVPSYLLISYEGNSYKIIGESDLETDKKANYKLRIGKPMDIPQSEPAQDELTIPDVALEDSAIAQVSADTASFVESDSITDEELSLKTEDSTLISSVTEEVLSDETVAVPKKYVYILIGLLTVIAVVVVFARQPKRSNSRRAPAKPSERETTLVRNDKTFESFVVALFDPHYFKAKNHTRKKVYAGNTQPADFVPSLELDFQNKDTHVIIAIECIFIPQLASRQILSYSANQINRYHDFEEDTGMEVYIVVGLEGDPHDPKELFLIPAGDLREGYLGYQDLQPFRKHGMFFYNSVRRRLL